MYNIYKIVNSINDKVYIGRTIHSLSERWKGHMQCLDRGDTRHLYTAMRKYGVDKFHIELIEECESFEDMVNKEAYYCSIYEAYTKGYNMTTGEEINPMECEKSRISHDHKMREENVRNKISESMKRVRAESDKKILIHKGIEGKRVSEDELPKYLSDGWDKGSNEKGKIRIYRISDLKETAVWENQLDNYLANGWLLGGKPNRISEKHRKALDLSHYKKVYAILKSGEKSEVFECVKEACEWWYNILIENNYNIINRAHKYHYALADIIKKSSKENVYIYDTLWIYI